MKTLVFVLIFIIIVRVITWFIFRGVRRTAQHIGWNQRHNKLVILMYVGILFVAAVVYEFIPVNGEETITQQDFEELEIENELFEKAFRATEESEINSKFLVEEWTQELKGNKLEIISKGSSFPTDILTIERTDSKDQLVEIKRYQSNIIMQGINLKGRVPLSTIVWEGDQLVLVEPVKQEIKFYKFSDQLAILSMNDILFSNEFRRLRGDTYLYLKVPKHIEVIDKSGLQFY